MSYPLLYGQQFYPLTEVSKGQRLHPEAANAYVKMRQAADDDGITLSLYSSYRSFSTQQVIWDRKWLGERPVLDDRNSPIDINQLSDPAKLKAILRWSALPGTSRHHWGTDIDLYSEPLKTADFDLTPGRYQRGGEFYPLWQWLEQHAATFGFFFPYRQDLGATAPEPWHLSYTPLAQHFKSEHQLSELYTVIEQSDIAGKATILQNLAEIYSHYFEQICEPL